VNICIASPIALDDRASQAEKAKPKIQHKIQSKYKTTGNDNKININIKI